MLLAGNLLLAFSGDAVKREESETHGAVRDTRATLSRLHEGEKRFNRQFPHLKTTL